MHYNLSYISHNKRKLLAEKLEKDYKIQRSLGCMILKEANIVPSKLHDGVLYSGGIVSSDDKFQKSSAWHEGCQQNGFYNSEHIVTRKETVVYLGCLYHIWGHAITDNLKKVWYLRKHNQEHKIVYITYDNAPLPQYVYELFELAGINLNNAEHIKKVTKFEKVINPDNSIININEERYFKNEFIETIEHIKSQITASDIKKVYFTRTHLKKNRDIGEKQIEKFFLRKGYNIIAPEEHSIKEQLSILKGCTAFASTEGSISHSTLFCMHDTETCLIRKADFINPYSCFINQICSINVTYIDAHRSSIAPKLYPWRGPFYLYTTYWLSLFSGAHGIHMPYFLHRSWYEYRYNLSERIKDIYYRLRATLGIKTHIREFFKKK